MTSWQPYWCSNTKKRRPHWCTKPILRELNSFFLFQQTNMATGHVRENPLLRIELAVVCLGLNLNFIQNQF